MSREVPPWSRDNRCYSCHNNGDAARACTSLHRQATPSPRDALADTTRWLVRPADWDHNGGEGPFNDRRLARIVFTTTLVTAVETRWVGDRSCSTRAARRLASDQAPDGSWPLDGEDGAGSPASYGRPLATLAARNCLASADPVQFRTAVDRADAWLKSRPIQTVTDASVCLMTCATTQCASGQRSAAAES